MEEKKERKSWRDIVSSRNPDLDLEDDLAVGEFLDDSFKRYDDSESQRENLNKVLAEDSRAAGILTGLASGMDENGMGVSIGRLREDSMFDFKFVGLSHNTVRGAAGGAVLCAEALTAKGFIQAK